MDSYLDLLEELQHGHRRHTSAAGIGLSSERNTASGLLPSKGPQSGALIHKRKNTVLGAEESAITPRRSPLYENADATLIPRGKRRTQSNSFQSARYQSTTSRQVLRFFSGRCPSSACILDRRLCFGHSSRLYISPSTIPFINTAGRNGSICRT